ncbi:MAG: SNF2-related protein [Nitrosotalea sp.]
MDRYPLEIRSKSIWHRKVRKVIVPQKKWTRIEKLRKATPGPQFRGNLLDFQREGLDFLLKSYGNALLADEMGLGKCLKGDTLINTTNGSTTIKEIWEQAEVTEQYENEEWAKLKTPINIQTFDGKNITSKQVNKVFRQKINEPTAKIILKDGSEIECTKRHRFLTPDGWKRAGELGVNDKVAVPTKTIHDSRNSIPEDIVESGTSLRSLNLYTPYKYTQGMSKQLALHVSNKLEASHHDLAQQLQEISLESINWCQIKSVEEKQFCGHVYDLSVPETHNYIANGIITHNTVQTLAYLATEKQTFPVLIVAPLVTLNNWQRETQKFLKKRSRNGKISENEYPSSVLIRTGKAQELGKYDVYIINYDLLHKRIDDLSKLNIKTIVCDEVQHLRSKTTKKYIAVKKLAALDSIKYRVGLSGTPIYNRGSEIWPIVDILRPGLLGTFDEFCEYFCYVNEKGKAIVLENKRASLGEELRKHVMLRRKKSDVLKELKDKVRYKELIDSDINYYQTELGKIWERLEAEQKNATSAFDKFSSYKRAIQSERQAAGVAKVPHVIEFVKNIMEIEESVVVFCHHKAIHELLHRSLSEYTPASIIGGQSDKERQEGIDRFQNGETKLIIAGLRAGNVGINLSRARYVIFAELDWSPAIHRQAEDRLHRIGQKNTVFAYYLMGKGTLDDHVANVLVDKSYEIDAIMDEKAETFENKEKAELILAQIHDKLTHNIAR